MITVSNTQPPTYYGLSTDIKLTAHVENGSSFVEMDTGIVWFFDESTGQWLQWGA